MKDEYIIINKTELKKDLENLKLLINKQIGYATQEIYDELENLGSKSTPLIPEIEKAYNAGKIHNELSVAGFDNPKGRYISNLKLEI